MTVSKVVMSVSTAVMTVSMRWETVIGTLDYLSKAFDYVNVL